jgi:putative DNA primase/helicase
MSRHPETTNACELAARLGLHRTGREWRGACPICSYPGAFVLSERQGQALAWCASCQDREAVARLLRDAGALPERRQVDAPARPDPAAAARRTARALALWAGAEPAPGTAAERYLSLRKLPGLAASPALRFRADCPHPNGGRLPALIALVQTPDGGPTAVHRTFLKCDGAGKADIEPAKASLGPISGGAIRLAEAGPELVVGEGIESAASAGRMLGLPAWSAISAGNLARGMVLPAEVRDVLIAVDADAPGERAAREAAWRWQREGRRVRLARPNIADTDFNDLIVRKQAHA